MEGYVVMTEVNKPSLPPQRSESLKMAVGSVEIRSDQVMRSRGGDNTQHRE